jgi:hypothetical protein
MPTRTVDPTTADQNAVMSWLQDREMRDHKLADARSGIASAVIISSVIGRMQEKAYAAFPHIDRNTLDGYVRRYVDPAERLTHREGA